MEALGSGQRGADVNQLFYGDNLEVLRGFPDGFVDLVYLDPPFNSNAGYNVLFKSAAGAGADASIEAFDDTWTWGLASKNALMDIWRLMAVRLPERKGVNVSSFC